MALDIKEYKETDWPEAWSILEPAFRAGESYPCAIDITEREARRYWIETPRHVFVARDDAGAAVGTYYMRPDQGGLGDHICNCGYVVALAARGRGCAVEMCRHSQAEARKRGFTGMKFNLVVATNEPAIKAWLKCGMRIIGTTPKAFRHARLGLVDAHIMFKDLTAG